MRRWAAGARNVATLLREATDRAALLVRVEAAPTPLADGWQAQIQARIQRTASSDSDEAVRSALLAPCHDVGAQVRNLLAARGPEARLLVLPEGPQTVVCPALSAPVA